MNTCSYRVTYQEDDQIYEADLLLSFDNSDKCTISSLTEGVTATGSGAWGDNTEKKAWADKDRDGMELEYKVDFGGGHQLTVHEKMIWERSGVTIEEFGTVYSK